MVLSKNIILPSCDHTFTNPCSSLAFCNILILLAVKLSVTLVPFRFKTFLFLYIIFLVLYLKYFTIMGRGLVFLDFQFSSSLWPINVFRFIFLIHMFFYFHRQFIGVFTFCFISSMNQKAVTPRTLFFLYLVLHASPQIFRQIIAFFSQAFFFLFLFGFSFMNIHNSQDSRGSGRLFL